MVVLCPMCYLNLRKLVRDEGMEALFITELCRRAIGEPLPVDKPH